MFKLKYSEFGMGGNEVIILLLFFSKFNLYVIYVRDQYCQTVVQMQISMSPSSFDQISSPKIKHSLELLLSIL